MFLKLTSAEGTRNKSKASAEGVREPSCQGSLTPSALALFLFHAPSALVLFQVKKKPFKEILKYPEKKIMRVDLWQV